MKRLSHPSNIRPAGLCAVSRRRGLGAVLALVAVAGLFAAACGGGADAASSSGRSTRLTAIQPVAAGKTLTVVATTTQLADFVRNVGGDQMTVVSLLGPNQDPHEFEPKPEDVQKLNGADIIFKNGVGLERHWAKILDNVPATVPIVDTSAGVKLRQQDGESDPHIWHNPPNAEVMVGNVRDGLSRRDPNNAATYQANAYAYDAQLTQLDASIRQQFTAVPAQDRKLVTNHDAFGYFVDAYGLDFLGSVIPSGDTTAEPKPGDIQKLVETLKDQHVCAIFTESSINPKLEQQLATDAGVAIYSNLYGDTLGPAGSDGSNYIDMENANTTNMIKGMTQTC
jgi:ABC-type Zn uptake system ZnuABC Zn-binding protein ZnuA